MVNGKLQFACAALLLCASWLRADVAVPREGPPLEGGFVFDKAKRELVIGEERRSVDEFLLVESEDGQVLWAPDFAARVHGYRRLVAERRRPQFVELIKWALRARDHTTARRLFVLAHEEGLSGRDDRVLDKRILNLEKKPKKIRAEQAAAVQAGEKKVRQMLPDLLVARAAGEMAPGGAGYRLLRVTLREDPRHGGAWNLLDKHAPAENPFGDLRVWLDWHLDLEVHGFRVAPKDLRELKQEQYRWRPDVYGVMSERVLVITPVKDIAVIRDCALRAHITIGVLEGIFATKTPRKRPDEPLLINLYENQENFREQIGYKDTAPVPPYYQWQFGRWRLHDDVCRFLYPGSAKPARERFNLTVAHEVVRHWLERRNPRYSSKELWDAGDIAGYWINVGFPAFVAAGKIDLDAGTLDLATRATPALKTTRRLAKREKGLMPWEDLLYLSMGDVGKVADKDPAIFDLTKLSRVEIYAHQATATCHFLYNADDGQRREALVEYLVNRYIGNQPELAPQKAFGLTAEQLGRLVERWVH